MRYDKIAVGHAPRRVNRDDGKHRCRKRYGQRQIESAWASVRKGRTAYGDQQVTESMRSRLIPPMLIGSAFIPSG